MTEEQLDRKFSFLEDLMKKASTKDMPGLVATYNKLMDRAVEMDMQKKIHNHKLKPPKITKAKRKNHEH